jgi:hypothetical protein
MTCVLCTLNAHILQVVQIILEFLFPIAEVDMVLRVSQSLLRISMYLSNVQYICMASTVFQRNAWRMLSLLKEQLNKNYN